MSNKNDNVLLEVKHLKKYFKNPRGMLHAVDDVSFTLERGKTLGVVGESGCGKSTLGRTVIGLLDATDGEIIFEGENILGKKKKEWKELRKKMQIIFQDPMSSLDPRYTVYSTIEEPFKVFNTYPKKAERDKKIKELMALVGLAERLEGSYPHELDGGRRQRIGVARALAFEPKLIVCDEPVSALDVSIQAQVLNLLQDLQEQFGMSYIFVTHDMSVVKHISDDILVMYLGCVAEKAPVDDLFEAPLHPYTKGLLAAVPVPDINARSTEMTTISGELSSPIEPKDECRFAKRCPYVQDKCRQCAPPLVEARENHFVACHFYKEINGIEE